MTAAAVTTAALWPRASLLVPCRNEGRHIAACLDSLLAMDYPAERLEILVLDGMSDDDTAAIVRQYAERHPSVRLIENPRQITPAALNVGIQHATGDVVFLIGAHSIYPSDYVRELVGWMQRSGADVVGGVCKTVPSSNRPVSRGIAAAMAHPFGVGNSYFRIGSAQPRWVDTVPFGCYRRDVFRRFGGFDEDLVRNQDDEFNLRVLKARGRLLLVPEVVSKYYARESLRQVWRMFYQYGYYKPLVARKLGRIMTARQLAPAALVLGLLGSGVGAPWLGWATALFCAIIGVYGLAVVSSALAARQDLRTTGALALTFPVIHLSYGLGFVAGSLRLARGEPAMPPTAVPLSR